MRIIEKLYKGETPLYPIETICDPQKALFIDIETTGLKKETTSLYMIGCGHYTAEGFMTLLLFGESCDDEPDLLLRFKNLLAGFTTLLHFNGNKFDIPYLQYKADIYGISDLFHSMEQVDIYRLCAPLRYLLFPDSMRQKAIESFLNISRDDMYNGGELIDVYKEYTITNDPGALELLVTHNREDVLGMHRMLPILYYLDLKDAPLCYKSSRINIYKDLNGEECKEMIFDYTTSVYFPKSFSAKTETMYVRASADTGNISIRLAVYTGEMRFYFENYRDYCYIPSEDRVIPRSMASSLPKGQYCKATRENCFQKVTGEFLKQPCDIFTPVLRTSYKDRKKYFRIPEEFEKEAAEQFGRKLINIFFTMKRR